MKRTYSFIIFILLIAAPLIFFTDLTRNPYYFQIVLLNAFTVILWMIYLGNGLREKALLVRSTPLDKPLVAFLVAASFSWIYILFENLRHPYLGYGIFSEGLKAWLFLVVNAILVYYAAVYFVSDTSRKRFLLAAFWTGIIASIYGVMQYFGVELIWSKVLTPFGGRSVSTFGNPNFLSSYLVLLIPVAYACYIYARDAGRRFFYLAAVILFYIGLLCTITRSSLLGLFVAMVLMLIAFLYYERELVRRNLKRFVIVPAAILILLTVIWPKSSTGGYSPSVMGRLMESTEATTTYYGSWHQRRLIWSCAWHMVRERPVLGKGWGCFELFYPFYQGRHLFLEPYRTFRTHANNSHNEILEIWSQTGIVGFGVYLWLMVCIGALSLFLIRNLKDEKRYLAIGLSASLAGMITDNLLNVSLHFAVPGFLFWWNLGLLAGLGKNPERPIDLRKTTSIAAVLVLLILGGASVVRYADNFMGEVNYFKGFKLSKSNLIQAAIPYLEQAHRLQRFEVNNNYELANCYARAGMREKSVGGYVESLRANAGYDEIYFNLATVLMQMGKPDEAVDEYTRSLYINPLSQEAYAALGSYFLQDPEKFGAAGIELFKQSVSMYPLNKDIWNNLGYLYSKKGDEENALTAYRKALDLDPDFELARRNVQVTLHRLGRTDPHLDEVNRLLRAVESNIVAKNWQAALANSERLEKLVPKSFKARFYLANVYFTLGRLEDAVREYRKTLEIEPNNPALLCNLGMAYSELKQYGPARECLQKALQIDPNNQAARQKLAEIPGLPPPPVYR